MRIGGMASGMDIDKLVGDLMKAEKQPLTGMEQEKTTLEWKRDSYRETNKLLKSLDDLIFNGINKESKLKSKAVSSTNESMVTASASASASDVTTTMQVNRLATSTSWVSNNTGVLTKDFSSFSGQTIKLNVTKGDGTAAGPVEIKLESGDTLESVLKKLNENEELGVTSFYDNTNEKVVLTKDDTGAQSSIEITDATTASILKELGFVDAFAGGKLGEMDADLDGIADDIDGDGNTFNENGVRIAGQDAEFKINGYLTTRSSNEFTINEVTYKLNAADSTKTTTIKTTTDTDAIFDNIKSFVDKYNEVIKSINEKTSESKNRDFPPLTEEQKKDMEEKEIELWEEKAKSGLLRSDSVLENALNSMRISLYTPVEGVNTDFDVLTEIGITTSSNYKENGKLEINEDKLKEAINNNPEEVYQLFNSTGSTYESKGIVDRLRDTISSTIKSIERKAGNEFRMPSQYSLGKEMNQLDDEMDRFNDRLIQIEDRYWRQFTAMETAINKYNSQFAMLMGQAGGGY
ncbi:flagellar hook-associated protein 2 [Rossellomorea aquimaris]|nr:flagellar hook-associated protein 2 [Rossellomorea aquimaris]